MVSRRREERGGRESIGEMEACLRGRGAARNTVYRVKKGGCERDGAGRMVREAKKQGSDR